MMRLTSHRQSTQHLSDYLPWAIIVAPGIIMQKDAVLQSSFQVYGNNFFCSHESVIESIISAANNMCMYCDAGWSVFVEAQRARITQFANAAWNHGVAKQIDDERKQYYLEDRPLFTMSYYITMCYKPEESQKNVSRFFSVEEHSLESGIVEFQKKLQDFSGLLKECFLEVCWLNDDQQLTYLHSCVSNVRHSVLAPPCTMYIDSYVCDESLSIGECLRLGAHTLGVISVHDFPHATRPDVLEELQKIPIAYRWQTRMIFLDESQAIAEIKRYRRKHYAQRKGMLKVMQEQKSGEEGLENTEAIMKALDAEEALELAGKNMVRFGYLTSVIVVSDTDTTHLTDKIACVKEVFNKKGFIVKEEQLNAMDAWLSSLPGHVYSNVRRALVHSVNFAHILPLSARWQGLSVNYHLQKVSGNGAPHIIANAQSNVFYFNLNHDDVGHTFIVGPTGSGKSTLLGMLCVQFLRYPNAQVIIFDKDYSAHTLTKKLDGACYVPGLPVHFVAFQPFRDVDEEKERMWALQYCSMILELHDIKVQGDMVSELKRTLVLLSKIPKAQRTMTAMCHLIQDKHAKQVLKKYCGHEGLGSIFDGVEDKDYSNRWLLFEMRYLMELGQDAVIPALSYLFHKVECMFNGNPTLLVLDEGWLFLQHPSFSNQFKIWLKTLRKKNVFVIMATQELADAVKSPLLETIISACQTRIFLPDSSAMQAYMKELYYNFGLHERELQIIAHAQSKKEYYISTNRGSCLFSLDLGEKAIDILHNSEGIAI